MYVPVSPPADKTLLEDFSLLSFFQDVPPSFSSLDGQEGDCLQDHRARPSPLRLSSPFPQLPPPTREPSLLSPWVPLSPQGSAQYPFSIKLMAFSYFLLGMHSGSDLGQFVAMISV